MHFLSPSFWVLHVAMYLAFESLFKFAGNLFHKLTDGLMNALGINALLDLIYQAERALKMLAVASVFILGAGLGLFFDFRRA